jgi:hypothetical protein
MLLKPYQKLFLRSFVNSNLDALFRGTNYDDSTSKHFYYYW